MVKTANRNTGAKTAVWLGQGQFSARVYGASGATNIVEATTDFTNWTSVVTSIGIYDFIDATAGGHPQRFYRAKLVP